MYSELVVLLVVFSWVGLREKTSLLEGLRISVLGVDFVCSFVEDLGPDLELPRFVFVFLSFFAPLVIVSGGCWDLFATDLYPL